MYTVRVKRKPQDPPDLMLCTFSALSDFSMPNSESEISPAGAGEMKRAGTIGGALVELFILWNSFRS